jgi:hypothetical protein
MHPKVYTELRDAPLAGGGKKFRVWEAAEYLRVSASKLNKLRLYGGGPTFFKVGSTVIYAQDDLDVWLAAHRRASTSESKPR